MLNRDQVDVGGGHHKRKLKWVWLENASSTMDEARILIQQEGHIENIPPPIIAVATANQVGFSMV